MMIENHSKKSTKTKFMITATDKQTALVLIDLQKGIVSRPTATPVNEIIDNVIKLIDAFRKKGLPIIFTNVIMKDSPFARTRKQQPMQGAPTPDFSEIIPDVNKQPKDLLITKHSWNAFFETPLEEELKSRGITGIVVGGVSTSIGVEGTARAASERGYNIAFAKDAMTDTVAEAHERSVKYIFPRMGEVGDTDEIIEKLV